MKPERCFELWAPDGVAWSQWAKPALFTQLQAVTPKGDEASEWSAYDVSWLPDPRDRTALVIDLPGHTAVVAGLALAQRGFRPVPLFNTCLGPSAVIDCDAIARMLEAGAEELAATRVESTAPPAFLLDSRRMRPTTPPDPGKLDNRWVVFPQDFPSATYLRSRGIEKVVVVQEGSVEQEDLVHVLLRWREGGLQIRAVDARGRGSEHDVVMAKPSLFKRAWYRVLAMAGLRRNQAGGFGAVIPVPSQGGGYG